LSESGHNPYQPPDAQRPTPKAATELASAGRRLASTVICTGGIAWCLISVAVFIQTWLDPLEGANLRVFFLFAAIGATTFVLGVYIRLNKTRHIYLSFLVILLMLVLFPLVAMEVD
jgi:hypothetical protein